MGQTIKTRIEAAMKRPSPENATGVDWALSFLANLYAPAVRLRADLFRREVFRSRRLPCRVISVGNLAVGGAGKTPMTIYLAEMIRRMNRQVGILSRGYGGLAEKTGGLVSDGVSILMNAREAGDEPFLMARRLNGIPVSVGRDRYASGMRMIDRFHPDVLILDDGFQHLRLQRDMDIVLLDTACPFGNTHVLPRGVLREPQSALHRADAIVLTRADAVNELGRLRTRDMVRRIAPKCPIFTAVHVPALRRVQETGAREGMDCAEPTVKLDDLCRNKRVFAFSGIASNEDFKRVISFLPCELVDFAGFPDHHDYSTEDTDDLRNRVATSRADLILTTEKDYVRFGDWADWPSDLAVLGVDIRMEDEDGCRSFIATMLEPVCRR